MITKRSHTSLICSLTLVGLSDDKVILRYAKSFNRSILFNFENDEDSTSNCMLPESTLALKWIAIKLSAIKAVVLRFLFPKICQQK